MQYSVSFNLDFKRNPYPGRFIVLEGIDGSGKTTQVSIIAQKLGAIVTKEPTTGPIGQFIRQRLAGALDLPPVALQHLLSADRAVHEEEIKKLLDEGKTVISDRYLWSSVAYGMADREGTGYTDGEVLLVAQSILSMYHQFILPNLTFYLTVSVDTALARIEKMGKVKEMYEYRDKLEKIKKGYDWLLAQFPKEIIAVDGERPVEEVTRAILAKLKV